MPRTAGKRFRLYLNRVVEGKLRKDYGDHPVSTGFQIPQQVKEAELQGVNCVYGHFLPVKYTAFTKDRGNLFIMWMRDPVTRVLSHYYYWKSQSSKRNLGENYTLEEFCFKEWMRNIYTKFLTGFHIGRFNFIGITERYKEDLQYFADNFTGVSPTDRELGIGYRSKSYSSKVSKEDWERLAQFNAKDMDLYTKAKDRELKHHKEKG